MNHFARTLIRRQARFGEGEGVEESRENSFLVRQERKQNYEADKSCETSERREIVISANKKN